MVTSSKILPLIFIFLSFCCMNPKRRAEAVEAATVTIHIIIDMPEDSGITNIGCLGGEVWKMKPGEKIGVTRWPDRQYICKAENGGNKGSWVAFDPQRDAFRSDVFGSVREDGFYLGYDQSNWLRINGWQV